ncbi:hypothetical protein Tco_1033230 [Tanacetum coccineum]|uniref:Uncharacterized protein n=1 Tax=Tanacetum coccineum TaxID=301880 RepID=A0ABQ5GEB1_9ASTR
MVASFATQQLRQWQQPFMASLRALARLMMQPGVKGLRGMVMTGLCIIRTFKPRRAICRALVDAKPSLPKLEHSSPNIKDVVGDGGVAIKCRVFDLDTGLGIPNEYFIALVRVKILEKPMRNANDIFQEACFDLHSLKVSSKRIQAAIFTMVWKGGTARETNGC